MNTLFRVKIKQNTQIKPCFKLSPLRKTVFAWSSNSYAPHGLWPIVISLNNISTFNVNQTMSSFYFKWFVIRSQSNLQFKILTYSQVVECKLAIVICFISDGLYTVLHQENVINGQLFPSHSLGTWLWYIITD